MAKTILVVEDEPAVQELIAVNLEYSGYKLLRAADAERALQFIRASLPDLVLLDWGLPGMSGIEFVRRLRADHHTQYLPIILLSARSSEIDKIAGLDSGADDYVTKPFSPRELNARIKTILRQRAPQVVDETITAGGLTLNPSSHRVSVNGNALAFGLTEFRLLHLLMTHPDRTYSRAQVLALVWGHDSVEERAVDVYIRRLRQELERTGHEWMIHTVRGEGYRFCATRDA